MRVVIASLAILLMAWMGGGTWFWVCKVKGLCEHSTSGIINNTSHTEGKTASEKPQETPVENSKPSLEAISLPSSNHPLQPFALIYERNPIMAFQDNLRFTRSSERASISPTMQIALDSIARILTQYPAKEIEITGKFADNESNKTKSSNLGLARAAFLGQELTKRGVAANRIVNAYESVENNALFFKRDSLRSGVTLRLLDPLDSDAGSGIPSLLAESRDLYFKYNSSEVLIDEDLRNYISRAIQYLKQNATRKCLITGHTDSYGNPDANRLLGQQRADQIKALFVEFGLGANQITTSSKGQDEPKAPNNTSEGRRINRRVEIKIQ